MRVEFGLAKAEWKIPKSDPNDGIDGDPCRGIDRDPCETEYGLCLKLAHYLIAQLMNPK